MAVHTHTLKLIREILQIPRCMATKSFDNEAYKYTPTHFTVSSDLESQKNGRQKHFA